MAIISRDELKNAFKNGKKPTEKEFADLIDSYIHWSDELTKWLGKFAETNEARQGQRIDGYMNPFLTKEAIVNLTKLKDIPYLKGEVTTLIDQAITKLTDGAPEAFDTLKKIADKYKLKAEREHNHDGVYRPLLIQSLNWNNDKSSGRSGVEAISFTGVLKIAESTSKGNGMAKFVVHLSGIDVESFICFSVAKCAHDSPLQFKLEHAVYPNRKGIDAIYVISPIQSNNSARMKIYVHTSPVLSEDTQQSITVEQVYGSQMIAMIDPFMPVSFGRSGYLSIDGHGFRYNDSRKSYVSEDKIYAFEEFKIP